MHVSNLPSPTIRQSRQLVADLFARKAFVYWVDFLVCLLFGYAAAAIYLTSPALTWQQAISFLVAGTLLYRLGSFMHEIVHFRQGEMIGFQVVWNLLAGVPLLTPSTFYVSHIDHHKTHHYGTEEDGEYLPLGTGSWQLLLAFMSQVFLQPIAVFLRFLVVTPLSLLHPGLRRWTMEHASSFVIDFRYRRPVKEVSLWNWATALEVACSLRAAAILVFVLVGVNSWTRIPQLYSLAAFILALNHIRTLAAHRYLGDGEAMTLEEQLLDSTNITGVPVLTEILCPLGLRYHALHHLLPGIPYYNLGAAHRRLVAALPADAPYHKTVYASWFSVVREFIRGRSHDKKRGLDRLGSRARSV